MGGAETGDTGTQEDGNRRTQGPLVAGWVRAVKVGREDRRMPGFSVADSWEVTDGSPAKRAQAGRDPQMNAAWVTAPGRASRDCPGDAESRGASAQAPGLTASRPEHESTSWAQTVLSVCAHGAGHVRGRSGQGQVTSGAGLVSRACGTGGQFC